MEITRKRCSVAGGAPRVKFDIFISNHLTFFLLLTHIGVNNIRATRVLIGEKQLQNKERGHFQKRPSSKETV